VIGTERHESRRIDNQLRGRSGRQGDNGSSRFFLSLEDRLLRIFGGDKIASLMQNIGFQDSVPIQSSLLNQSLESAQQKVETYYFDIRKNLFEYDQALNMQRNGIYAERKRILERDNLRDWIFEYAERSLYDLVLFIEQKSYDSEVTSSVLQKLQNLLGIPFKLEYSLLDKDDLNNLVSSLHQQFRISYDLKEAELEMLDSGLMRELERSFLLQQIDFSWREHFYWLACLWSKRSIN
jgi:preprotein translocase subunit SecA